MGIPDQILRTLDEHTAGGYILFSFDIEGNPVISSNFDSVHHANSMHVYLKKWCEAIEVINSNMALNSLLGYQAKNGKKKN